ncbi:dihydropteroate synthase [Helicobacter enhydrae]|uniref:dihydropteroate synthase n=1 Tax=Helicobacter enhydrae TaxID=222136 RepID=A0A1B1U6U7_9HELI|nr:dihydropteroate synthase [Helicobacter enhydrae]ANV98527.1 dihydropteroate synthase [Helicobacter enhydrae]
MFIQRIHPKSFAHFLNSIRPDSTGYKIMVQKSHELAFVIFGISLPAMHILKQEALSAGAELATPKDAILCQKAEFDVLLFGTRPQILRIIRKCQIQPFDLKSLAHTLTQHLTAPHYPPELMAILNLTPDSFYSGSRFQAQEALQHIQQLIALGVQIIDIGAASSRPDSPLISSHQEIERLKPLLDLLPVIPSHIKLSIDTYNPHTAEYALSRGFHILNDIFGFKNPEMIAIAQEFGAKVVLMHSKGTPQTMQTLTNYNNLFEEIDTFFTQQIQTLQAHHIHDIILDIGFGFAKDLHQNIALIQHLEHFKHFHLPLLVGASRKNTIGLLTQQPVHQRLSGTLALHQIALQNGANILRIHDVQEHIDMIKILQALGEI